MSEKDYSNGKIYRILNTIDDDCYIGSTTQPLSKRMAKHRRDMSNSSKKHRPLYTKMLEYGADKFYIELVEDYPCENVEQLCKREGELIRQLGTLNVEVAGRSKVEYRAECKDRIKEQNHKFYTNNKEKILERNKEYKNQNSDHWKEWACTKYNCECGGKYTNSSKAEHMKSQRHIKFVEEGVSHTTIDCPCGGTYTHRHKAGHLKTEKHIKYMESLK